MAEFLAEHQAIAVPIIEWGGLFLLLLIILSPFLIIRHSYFKPTRWWHVVGAYLVSFLFLTIYGQIVNSLNSWFTTKVFTTWELYEMYGRLDLRVFLSLILIYPLFVFYSVHLVRGVWSRKLVIFSFLTAVLFIVVLVVSAIYLVAYGLGQVGIDHF